MDSRPRFTGDEAYYQMEDNFLEELESLPPLYGAAIIMQLDKLASDMYDENKIQKPTKKIGMVAGVVPLKDALFLIHQNLGNCKGQGKLVLSYQR